MNGPSQFPEQLIPMMNIFIFILGACIGSFLNVCIWRLPRNESVVSPPSHCPKCDYLIPWYDNIPLVSWLVLGARCRKCKVQISPRYFLVELLTGYLFLLVWIKVLTLGQPAVFIFPYFFLVAICIVTIFVDAEHRIIPNEITYAGIIVGLVLSVLWPELWVPQHRKWIVPERLISFMFSAGSMLICVFLMAAVSISGKFLFKKDAMGWGDVKYIGAVAALIGIPACFFTLLFGSLTGSMYGIFLMVFRKRKLRSAFPLGPFLAAGTLIWIYFGEIILNAYLEISRKISLAPPF
ncbi:MAG TPA: prepilin peptidase [Lentisphaeria bacterium]|nr:MAG: hypothetical protein A2X45_08355 [Lentisphaerae bacterium GWF2_50_93]HCE43784.1 prepilin peptidase [Lentisphaeria bacterium]